MRWPDTDNEQSLAPAALAAKMSNFAQYLMCAYADSAADQGLRGSHAAAGKKQDMGRSCLRVTSVEDLLPDALSPLLSATNVNNNIAQYEASRGAKSCHRRATGVSAQASI